MRGTFSVESGVDGGRIELDACYDGGCSIGIACAKIEGIDGLVVVGMAYLVVEMRTKRSACVAGAGYHISFLYFDKSICKVCVESKAMVGVLILGDELTYLATKLVAMHIDST